MTTELSDAAERFMEGPLLAEIPEGDRRVLFDLLEQVSVPSGTVFFGQGKRNDRLWFLVDGTAEIERTWEGKPMIIANLTPPGIFGATTFFRPTPATATIRASSPALLLTLDHPSHDRLRREAPSAAEGLALATVRILAERFDLLDQRMSEYITSKPEDHPRANEWTKFRSRLFGEPNII